MKALPLHFEGGAASIGMQPAQVLPPPFPLCCSCFILVRCGNPELTFNDAFPLFTADNMAFPCTELFILSLILGVGSGKGGGSMTHRHIETITFGTCLVICAHTHTRTHMHAHILT